MILRRAAMLVLLITSVLARIGFAAESSLLQATAVYGVIATDPIYLWIAQERGFFKKNGLNIDLTHIPTTQAVQALVSGKIHFTTAGPQIIEANLAGADTVYILSPVNTFVFSLYSKPEITTMKGLAGKTIGATNKGTPTDIAGHMVVAQSGLKPDIDVKFVYLKELPALVAALQQGIIDSAILSAPSTLTARNFGFRELLNITALKIPFVQHSIGATRSFINANQDLVRRFVRSAAEGIDYARKNRSRRHCHHVQIHQDHRRGTAARIALNQRAGVGAHSDTEPSGHRSRVGGVAKPESKRSQMGSVHRRPVCQRISRRGGV